MQSYQWDAISALRRDRLNEAENAVEEVSSAAHLSFYGWLRIGSGLAEMQGAAMELAKTNRPTGKAYNAAYNMIRDRLPKLTAIDKSTRSNAIWMFENKDAVEGWHAAITDDNKKRRQNHPATIKRNYLSDIQHGTGGKTGSSSMDKLKDEIKRLQEELDAANAKIRKLERGDDMLLISRKDSAQDILAVLESEIPTKTGRIAALLLNRQKSTAPTRRATLKASSAQTATTTTPEPEPQNGDQVE